VGGILGKLSFEHDETLAIPALEQMLGTMRHRGSTGSGIHVAPGIALGWCGDERSPITRPAVATNGDETVRVVADSSLTRTAVLRADLEARGRVVSGRSDADLIAHAYDEWGDACVEHLRGAFACAIWDERRQRLLLARDAIGIRPLFFAVLHGHGIVFASEIRALLQDPGVGREWCPDAIDAYLALGYIPAPLTAYRRISKLEPAQRLVVDGRRFHLSQYWDMPADGEGRDRHSDEALEAALHEATGQHLAAQDVTAALYSGGLASTAILASAPAGLDAVLVAAEDVPVAIDRALAAARRLGAEPLREDARPDAAAIAPQLAAYLDEPIADPGAVSHYATLVAARLRTRTALAGFGAATFWGARPQSRATRASFALWNEMERRGLYTRGFAWQVRHTDPLDLLAARPTGDANQRAPYVEAKTWLPDNTLAIVERLSLAAGIDLRLPFLDREVVELACRLRPRAGESREHRVDPLAAFLARRLPWSLLPSAATTHPHPTKTSPFPWMAAALNALVPKVLLASRFDSRGIVSRPVVRRLWDDHVAGRADHSHRLWSLLMLEFWFREFIDDDAAADEPFEYAILRAA